MGEGVTRFKKGDRVLSMSSVALRNDHRFGAHQRYTLSVEKLTANVCDPFCLAPDVLKIPCYHSNKDWRYPVRRRDLCVNSLRRDVSSKSSFGFREAFKRRASKGGKRTDMGRGCIDWILRSSDCSAGMLRLAPQFKRKK